MSLLLPYELIDIILKMASNNTDIYYLQVDHKTGKLIYKHNMKCRKLKIIKQTQFAQYVLYDDKMCKLWSYVNKDYFYKKTVDNNLFIYYKKDNLTKRCKGELIENGICYPISDYNIWSSIRHTDGWCYDLVGFPVFSDVSKHSNI